MMKSIKVFFNGKALRDIYPHATRWQVVKYKTKKFFRKLFLVTSTAVFLATTFYVLRYFFPVTTYAVSEKIVTVDTLNTKIEELKNDLVNTLQACESAGHSEDDGIIIFDVNNKASIGTFQFQKNTVIHYYKTLYNQDITSKQAVLIALDDAKARQLTKDIVFTTAKGLSNWANCDRKHGLSGQLSVIKKLEQ